MLPYSLHSCVPHDPCHRHLRSPGTKNNPHPLMVCHLVAHACIRPPFPYLEHLITLFLPAYTLNSLVTHALPSSMTSLRSSPMSQPLVIYIANNSCLISDLPPFASSSCGPFPSTHAFIVNNNKAIGSICRRVALLMRALPRVN